MVKDLALLPNIISLVRIALIIPIALLYSNPSRVAFWAVFILLVLSFVSDYLDGMLARMLNQQSRLGLILDPLADKMWTVVMIILIVKYRDLPIWIGVVIVLRDLIILSMNAWTMKRMKSVMSSDEFGRKYMVCLGLMVISFTLRIPGSIYLAYFVALYVPVTVVRYAYQVSQLLKQPVLKDVKESHLTL